MEKKTLKIEIPYGKKAVIKDRTIIIEDIPLPKTWEEYVENYPNIQTEKDCAYCIRFDIINRNRSPKRCKTDCNTLGIAEGIIALQQLLQLRDVYRQGWRPDWEDINEPKFSIVIKGDDLDIDEDYIHQSILCFPTLDIARDFMYNFERLIGMAHNLCQ